MQLPGIPGYYYDMTVFFYFTFWCCQTHPRSTVTGPEYQDHGVHHQRCPLGHLEAVDSLFCRSKWEIFIISSFMQVLFLSWFVSETPIGYNLPYRVHFNYSKLKVGLWRWLFHMQTLSGILPLFLSSVCVWFLLPVWNFRSCCSWVCNGVALWS